MILLKIIRGVIPATEPGTYAEGELGDKQSLGQARESPELHILPLPLLGLEKTTT